LEKFAKQAFYVDYRKKYWNYQLLRPIDWLCHWRYRNKKYCQKKYPKKCPDIEFIGVWDTVGAYGLPVEELRLLWDRFIYPLQFKDKKLSNKVIKACHALSIDDERHTFHPLLWNENCKKDNQCIEQVWFPGTHGDVGGGYPRSELALVSLDWLISKVESNNPETGLVFCTDLREKCRKQRNWNGKQHDSRAGLGALYRYKPRDLEAICRKAKSKELFMPCDEADNKGNPSFTPKIHRSVFERIKTQVVPYAPTGLPANYQAVDTIRTPVKASKIEPLESYKQAKDRHSAMNCALDVIFWRRLLYYMFLIVILVFIAFPVLVAREEAASCTSTGISCLLDPFCKLAKAVTPSIADYWITAFCQNPVYASVLFILLVSLICAKRLSSASTFDRATVAWSYVKWGKCPYEWNSTMTSRLRCFWAGYFGKLARKVWWCLIYLVIALAILIAVDKVVFHLRDCAGC